MSICSGRLLSTGAFFKTSTSIFFAPWPIPVGGCVYRDVILADNFPIHLGRGTKLCFTTLPLYLASVLLPVSLAVLVTAVGFLIAYIRSRPSRGYLLRDIVMDVGRWMLTIYLGYQVIYLSIPWLSFNTGRYVLLVAGALTLLILDFVGFSFSNSFILHEPIFHILKSNLTEGIVIEIAQYSIGILGAIAAFEEIWSLPLLAIPLVIAYFGFKDIKEVNHETLKIVEDMADIVDLRDIYTGGHSRRVSEFVHQILVQLKIFGPGSHPYRKCGSCTRYWQGRHLRCHPKETRSLSPEEMAAMQTHPQKGAELVSKYKDYSRGAAMINAPPRKVGRQRISQRSKGS